MDSFLIGAWSAIWLGILTSISPCPLATNVAAVSYISNRMTRPSTVIWSGLLYVAGRMMAYLALGIIMVASLLSIPDLSLFLQNKINTYLGPILILVGILLLDIIKFNLPGPGLSERAQKRLDGYGNFGAFIYGVLFALSFCPVSAALFFGSLVPLSVTHNSKFALPLLYGLGTGLPVIAVAFLVAMGARFVATFFNALTRFELYARRITGIVFILVGLYYTLIYIFGVEM